MATEHVLDGMLAHAGTTAGLIVARAAHLRPVPRGVSAAGAVLLLGALLTHLTTGLLVFTDSFDPRGVDDVLLGTGWGRSWAVLAVGSVLAARGAGRRSTELGVAVAVAGLVWLGHGASQGDWSALFALHVVHLAAVVAWASGLLALSLEIAEGGRPTEALRAFSRRAVAPAAGVALTGALLAARWLPSPGALATPWGVALVGKVVIVGAIGLTALANRRAVAGPDWARLDRGLFAELSWFVLALGAAALLTELETP